MSVDRPNLLAIEGVIRDFLEFANGGFFVPRGSYIAFLLIKFILPLIAVIQRLVGRLDFPHGNMSSVILPDTLRLRRSASYCNELPYES